MSLALVEISPSSDYLAASPIIDSQDPAVRALAAGLRAIHRSEVRYARAVYEWVRDAVAHSVDVDDPRITLTAAEVLESRVGLCFAKSHLLAALLRAEDLPAALCYQSLATDAGGVMLHGLVAVQLQGRWFRQDPRGNKPGIDAQFSIEGERLAWTVDPARGEVDYPELFAEPADVVLWALTSSTDALALCRDGLPGRLPDRAGSRNA